MSNLQALFAKIASMVGSNGRMKVVTQPEVVTGATVNITTNGGQAAINTSGMSLLSISMVATTLVGHNAVFEFSNDSTNGVNGNWKTVQVVRTDSNTVETLTGVMTATPTYGWELNVSAYAWFRVRAIAHTSGSASYVLKPGSYATEPIPSMQNAPFQVFSYSQAGIVAVNTVLMTIDCSLFRSLFIQNISMGTGGAVTAQWSNDGVTYHSGQNMVGGSTVGNQTPGNGIVKTQVFGRYFRLIVGTATTGGTTSFSVAASQTSDVSLAQVIGTLSLGGSTARAGFFAAAGVNHQDSLVALAASATFTGTSRDLTLVAAGTQFNNASTFGQEVRVSAESDVAGTLWIEASPDGTAWRRVKSVATAAVTGGGQYAEIVMRPSWRYVRVGYTNGAAAQVRFVLCSYLMGA